MIKTTNKKTIKQKTIKIELPALWKQKNSRIEIYDLHQVLLFDFSCKKCANKEQCQEVKRGTYCEVDDTITESFDIEAQVHGAGLSKYFVYTDDPESSKLTKYALEKIKNLYSR